MAVEFGELFPYSQSGTFLVLAENEETASGHEWRDVTGERYHFPNGYKNIISPGVPFVYYKGSRRSGGARTDPQYFGAGAIGDVYADPDTLALKGADRKWLADIVDYKPFPVPVPFRTEDGLYSELLRAEAPRN